MSSFFTIPYIAFLGFILLLISGVYIFLVKKLTSQNNQFCSIVGVVTSLADELKRLKEFISTTLINKPTTDKQLNHNDLIRVSDDSDNDTNTDSESDNDSDDSDNSDDDSDEDSDEDSNDDLSNAIASNLDIAPHDDIKYIQIAPTIETKEKDDLINILEKEDVQSNETETHNDEPSSIDDSTVTEDSTTDSVVDYKKLPVNKLRTLIVEKGLAEDASKLKKQVLLQLLEQN
jgi:hypothetical protein